MQYQSSNNILRQRRQQRLHVLLVVFGALLLVLAIYGFTRIGHAERRIKDRHTARLVQTQSSDTVSLSTVTSFPESSEAKDEIGCHKDQPSISLKNKSKIGSRSSRRGQKKEAASASNVEPSSVLMRVRLMRTAIPRSPLMEVGYGPLFDDLNEVQIEAAVLNGLRNPESVTDPSRCHELVKIATNDRYVVDHLSYSTPYLVPEAALMLRYIGDRFAKVVQETHSDGHTYRPIITSALRSESNVAALRRRNRNATENSCHRYGTTIDITYIRYLRDDGEVVNEEWLKRALANALYELRYEGICYVKYEHRQGCFHITMRNTEYRGSEPSHMCRYLPIKGAENQHFKNKIIKQLFNIKPSQPASRPHVGEGNCVEY